MHSTSLLQEQHYNQDNQRAWEWLIKEMYVILLQMMDMTVQIFRHNVLQVDGEREVLVLSMDYLVQKVNQLLQLRRLTALICC